MKIFSWGPNSKGQHGSKDYEDYSYPNCISVSFHLNDVKSIITGSTFSFIILKSGLLYACGNNNKGQLSLENFENINYFRPLEHVFNIPVKSIAAGWDFSIILTESGHAYSSGDNKHCQLGFDQNIKLLSKLQLVNVPPLKSIKAGMWHVIALTTNNEIWTWGYNHKTQLGIWPKVRSGFIPEKRNIDMDEEIEFIIAGSYHSGFMTKQYNFIMWGDNQHGQCGINREDDIDTKLVKPRKMHSSLTDIVQLESGWSHCVARDVNGTCFSWGQNAYCQLGRRLSDNCDVDPIPGPVEYFLANQIVITDISCGCQHNLALDTENSLWSWGWNDHGILGMGDLADRLIPEKVSQLVSPVSIISKGGSGSHSFAVML